MLNTRTLEVPSVSSLKHRPACELCAYNENWSFRKKHLALKCSEVHAEKWMQLNNDN